MNRSYLHSMNECFRNLGQIDWRTPSFRKNEYVGGKQRSQTRSSVVAPLEEQQNVLASGDPVPDETHTHCRRRGSTYNSPFSKVRDEKSVDSSPLTELAARRVPWFLLVA